MKKLFMVSVLLLVIGSLTYANDIVSYIDADAYISTDTVRTIDLKRSDVKYIEIITSKSKFRIHKCGKIEKLTWKEIHANEDDTTIFTVGSGELLHIEEGD